MWKANMTRKYTLTELDTMRQAIAGLRWREDPTKQFNGYSSNDLTSFNARVEDELRTHMANGTEPQELVEADRAIAKERHRYLVEAGIIVYVDRIY
jgi:hypothetical protein